MELEALEGMLDELPDYPLLVAPNKVPHVPRPLRAPACAGSSPAPPSLWHHRGSEYRWLARRKIRVALTSYDPNPPASPHSPPSCAL